MVSYMWTCFYSGLSRRLPAVVLAAACLACFFLCPVACAADNPLASKEFIREFTSHIPEGRSDFLTKRFEVLEEAARFSKKPLDESRKFLQSLIETINANYGLNLTIHEACLIVRENLFSLQLTDESQDLLLKTIALFESEPTQHFETMPIIGNLKIIWPKPSKWLAKNKKHKRSKHAPSLSPAPYPPLQVDIENDELPGSIYIGGVETLAGALIFTMGLVFPPAYAAGTALMTDGVRRVFNGLEELDKQHLESRSYSELRLEDFSADKGYNNPYAQSNQ